MSLLDNAKDHYKSQLAGGLIEIDVPEWNGKVYFKPAATFKQQQKIFEYTQKGNMAEALVETLMQRALTAEGKKMFSFADRVVLMNEVDPEVIVRVVTEINNTKPETNLGN